MAWLLLLWPVIGLGFVRFGGCDYRDDPAGAFLDVMLWPIYLPIHVIGWLAALVQRP